MRDWFRVEAAGGSATGKKGGGEILIFSHIGKRWWDDKESVEVKAFVEALKGLVNAGPGDITVRINSPGGDVGGGMTIYNSLRAIKNRVVCRVEGYAYSMASVIALAGRETQMADVAQFMVHNPTTGAWGGKREMERAIKALETATKTLVTAYSKKTGKAAADIEALMEETTFMTADEAKEFGFVDTILDGVDVVEGAVAACFDAGAWRAYYEGHGPLPTAEDLPTEGHGGSATGNKDARNEGGETDDAIDNNEGAGEPEETVMAKLTAKEIREACTGASAEFVLAQVEACDANEARTLVDVMKAHNAVQAEALAAANAATAAAEAEVAAVKAAPPVAPVAGAAKSGIGVKPLGMGGGAGPEEEDGGGDAVAAWDAAVENKMKAGLDRVGAIRAVAVKDPELHRAYLAAHNAESGRPAGRFAV